MRIRFLSLALGLTLAFAEATPAVAQDVPVTAENARASERPYSPYAGRNFPQSCSPPTPRKRSAGGPPITMAESGGNTQLVPFEGHS